MNQPLQRLKYLFQTVFIILFCLASNSFFAQNEESNDDLYTSFKDYTYAARELAYGHLNKSVYIDGETLGFTIYVFDKANKKYSTKTRNMYCTISDANGKVIKSKLVLIYNGVGSGSFFIDESFTSGNYTFKAFTNYMKNFEEQNYYIQNFRVVDDAPDETQVAESDAIDAQFLPEGGHMVLNVVNSMGVTIKDGNGRGIGNVSGIVKDNSGATITEFTTDYFGFSKFSFTPQPNKQYTASIDYNGEEKVFNLDLADPYGISMSLTDIVNRIAIQFKTNAETLPSIQNESYTMSFHNGKEFKSIAFEFGTELEVTKFINKEDLFSGINVFTVFNEDNKPLLERVYFNYDGIDLLSTQSVAAKTIGDSIEVRIKIPKVDSLTLQNFSISVLPDETKSYNHSHNILSYLYLQPYVKGYIENASLYFKEVDISKQRRLDMLLITQGWSSYNWNNLFKVKPKYLHNFEDGITVKATLGEERYKKYSFIGSSRKMDIIDVKEGENAFMVQKNYPFDADKLFVSAVANNGNLNRAPVYVQFSPSKVPEFDRYIKMLPMRKPTIYKDLTFQELLMTSWTGIEQLDEIVLSVDRKEEKMDEIKATAVGAVDEFDAQDRYAYRNFAMYLRSQGFFVDDRFGDFIIGVPGRFGARNVPPAIFINNVRMMDPSVLAQIDMSVIDYTVINKNGDTYSPGGSIKVYTDPTVRTANSYYSPYISYDFPVAFAENKRFYAPRYSFYKSTFFRHYGVVDWVPQAKVDTNGEIVFKFADMGYPPLSLFIEGATDDGFISETVFLKFGDEEE